MDFFYLWLNESSFYQPTNAKNVVTLQHTKLSIYTTL